jgi:micrococcal nuclease
MANVIPFRRKHRQRLPSIWTPYLRHRDWSAAQLRLTVWAGMLLGLLAYQATRLVPPPQHLVSATPALETPDPYDEARRSRANLEAQEGAPVRATLETQQDEPSRTTSHDRIESRGTAGPVRVIDGDTFDYQGTRVRIADIDTPEVHGRCAYETELAARATQRMRTLLTAGPFEMQPLASGRDEDRYGRKLRIVTRNGRSLGDLLVAEGLARTWTGRREPWCV